VTFSVFESSCHLLLNLNFSPIVSSALSSPNIITNLNKENGAQGRFGVCDILRDLRQQ